MVVCGDLISSLETTTSVTVSASPGVPSALTTVPCDTISRSKFSLITICGESHIVMPTSSPRPTWPVTLYFPLRPSLLWYLSLR